MIARLSTICVVCLTAALGAQANETLYNGIELPEDWPPQLDASEVSTVRPPYLASPPAVIPIDVGRQLFVDDFLIAETSLKRNLHALEPFPGNPVMRPDQPWEQLGEWNGLHGAYAIPFSDGVWYDPQDQLFKMWYMSGLLYATCYATSKDGITWDKPSLDVVQDTNIVQTGNRDASTVWLDLDAKDPAHRYMMFRFQKAPKRGFVVHSSADGIHWSDEMGWAGPCNDRTTMFYNPFRSVWVCSIKAALPDELPGVRIRRYSEGPDPMSALSWSDADDPCLWAINQYPDPEDPGGTLHAEVYNLDAVAYESLLLGLFTIHERPADKGIGRPKRNQVFPGFSRDGFHWHRPYREPFYGVSEQKGAWNWGNVQSVGGCCLVVGDRLYFYHSGRAGSGDSKDEKLTCDSGASTGLGFLRRDGFASMDATESEGTLTTRPVRFSGKHLFVNVNSSQGELRAEVLDADGKVIQGFSCDDCPPIKADKTLQPVQWRDGADLAALSRRPVRFRFYLKQGQLYSFWVARDASGASHGYVAAGGPGFTGHTDTQGLTAYPGEKSDPRQEGPFKLTKECSLDGFGGVPFPHDLDGDGRSEVLWLQSPGMFHSEVFDTPDHKSRFTDAERNHFCLTATDASGAVLWRIGEPWNDDRPFVTHGAERALDMADIDGDGRVEVVCVRHDEILVIDGKTGDVKKVIKAPADNAQLVRLGHTGPGAADWTILVKNTERAYSPHEYANPIWFYDSGLNLLKTSDYLGAGHTPLVSDIDGDGFDEFVIGFNLVDHTLETVWTYWPVPEEKWNAGEMHVDDIVAGEVAGKTCVVYAASDVAYVLDAKTGQFLWKRKSTHPQHCQIGRFHPDLERTQVFVHNKRAELQLFDPEGQELWTMMPPKNFPLGEAEPCRRQDFHVFDPTTVIEGLGPNGTDLLIFTDGGWPYVINGRGQRCAEFPHTPNAAQDWGEVPGRPDDYGYAYYARVADFDGDGSPEVLLNDRRFAWVYDVTGDMR